MEFISKYLEFYKEDYGYFIFLFSMWIASLVIAKYLVKRDSPNSLVKFLWLSIAIYALILIITHFFLCTFLEFHPGSSLTGLSFELSYYLFFFISFVYIIIYLFFYIKTEMSKDKLRIDFFNSLVIEQVNTIQEDRLFSDPPKNRRFISDSDLLSIKNILKTQNNKKFDQSNTIQFNNNDINFSVTLSQSFHDYFYSKMNKTLPSNKNIINNISFCEELIKINPFDVMDLLDLSSLFEINKDSFKLYDMIKI